MLSSTRRSWPARLLLLACAVLALGACRPLARAQVLPAAPATAALVATATVAPAATPPSTATPAAAAAVPTQTGTLSETGALTDTGALSLANTEQDAAEEAAQYSPDAPVALVMPALALTATVAPMGWELVLNPDQQVTTRWVIPLDTAGWAVNSVAAGQPGNMIIAGHQMLGAAVFRPLALDEVQTGQDIFVTTATGKTVHYRVTTVSPPIPAIGATADEAAQAAAYAAPAKTPILTLITGWPVDVSTHRIFVQAEWVADGP